MASDPSASPGTAYYFGDVAFFSPDGNKPAGKTVSLVKRIIKHGGRQIVEIVLQPARDPRQKPKEIVTTMRQVADTKVFQAADREHTFAGSLTFKDDSFDRWTYDIRLKDGSRIIGEGALDAEGIKTNKTFSSPQGAPIILIKEDLRSITASEYRKHRRELLGNRPPSK